MHFLRTITAYGGGPIHGGLTAPGRELTPTSVAIAALCEAGRIDLALGVFEDADGRPAHARLADSTDDADSIAILRAFALAQSTPTEPVTVAPDARGVLKLRRGEPS